MGTKPKEIDSDAEFEQHVAKLHSSIGREVLLSHHYVRGAKPILVAIPTSGGDGNHGSQELAEF